MSSIYTNTNLAAFNAKQIRQAAVNTGVMTPSSSNHGKNVAPSTLRSAIQAL